MEKKLKIAFYVYPTAFQNPGGGEIQLLKTKEFLEKEGLPIALFNPWQDKLSNFDILHTFGSVKEALPMMESAHCAGVRNVLSTICWYNWKSAWGTYSDFKNRSFSILRHTAKICCPFLPSKRKRMMQIANLLFPNSMTEAQQLRRFFGVPQSKIVITPNAVDEKFLHATPNLFAKTYKLQNFVLCVGRIEPRKNQLAIVRALKSLDAPVVFIGDYVSHYRDYYETCRREAGKNMRFLGTIPHDSELLKSAYAACDTFLLPSWLETPGLAALEAGLAGAKVVITREGATQEYFASHASYVNPNSSADILTKTQNSLRQPKTNALQKVIAKNFLWQVTAKKTLQAYQDLMAGKFKTP